MHPPRLKHSLFFNKHLYIEAFSQSPRNQTPSQSTSEKSICLSLKGASAELEALTMATGRGGRSLMGPLLAGNFVVHLIILGLAGWSLDKYIDGEQNHPHLGGNPSTSFMLIFALIAGVTGACCVVAGFLHYRAWRSDSLAAAASSAIISWAITALAVGMVCKEIILGGYRGKRLQTLEALIMISTVSQLLYLVLLHAGLWSRRNGPGYCSSYGTEYSGINTDLEIHKAAAARDVI